MGKYDSLNLFTDEEDINPEIFVSIANELAESNRLKILELRLSNRIDKDELVDNA